MIDILIDEDLEFEDGDFAIGISDKQHIKHILKAFKGEFKEFPELGVGIEQMINDDNYMDVLIEAKKNLQYDGVEVKNIKFTDEGKLNVDGEYKDK
ncbi:MULTISPECIES: oxidase [unclassified Empedobacter]|uniref:oxidase n=1 Tax=unclassified Empedobacter TaxID=2643773 RepID=UPI0025C49726|nr:MULTISPECIES: oxidase [unclassified Empedobacter]